MAAFAQDSNSSSGDNFSSSQGRTHYTPGGDDTPPASGKSKSAIVSDSATISGKSGIRPTSTEEVNKDESEDESVISFNFLYYIIRKYKMQDIVD